MHILAGPKFHPFTVADGLGRVLLALPDFAISLSVLWPMITIQKMAQNYITLFWKICLWDFREALLVEAMFPGPRRLAM